MSDRKRKPKGKAHPPQKQRKTASASAGGGAITRPLRLPEKIEKALLEGDLSSLTVEERLVLYYRMCRTLRLNPLTRPFEYVVFRNRDDDDGDPSAPAPGGRMVLYARADCAAQLRKIHGISVTKLEASHDGEHYVVVAHVRDRTGKEDVGTGVVWLKKWKRQRGGVQSTLMDLRGVELANALMKAETKAKRRATLSCAGLAMLDESELDDVIDITDQVSSTGRVVHVDRPKQEPQVDPTDEDAGIRHEVATIMAQNQIKLLGPAAPPFNELLSQARDNLKKQTFAQVRAMRERLTAERIPLEYESPEVHTAASSTGGERSGTDSGRTVSSAPSGAPSRESGPAKPASPSYQGVLLKQFKNGTYRIEAPEDVLRANKDLFGQFWNGAVRALVISDQDSEQIPKIVGKLIGELERRRITFRLSDWNAP